jgi:hypothetical protein
MNFFLKLFGGESLKKEILDEVKKQQEVEMISLLEDTDVELDDLESKVALILRAHEELLADFEQHRKVWGGSTIEAVYEVVGTVAKKHDNKVFQKLGGEIDALQDQIFAIQEQLGDQGSETNYDDLLHNYEALSQESYPWHLLTERHWRPVYEEIFLDKLRSLLLGGEEDSGGTWEGFRERLIDAGLYDTPTFWYQTRDNFDTTYAVCPEDEYVVVNDVTMTKRDALIKLAWETIFGEDVGRL